MKRLIILMLSVVLIVSGLWFTTTNGYKFIKGYLLFKTSESQQTVLAEPIERDEEPEAETPEVETKETVAPDDLYPVRPTKGEHIGELLIPSLNAELPIYHGTHEDELEKGVGHFEGSVLPGENDNSVLSGHRDTVFRKLGEVEKGELLVVRTSAGEFTYKVRRMRIVDKEDRTVIVPKPKATLTISTCYPFDFIGAAPDRYIIMADLVSAEYAN
ncbi:class D sortase [Alkalihalophilus sp. As8PL]|uniref:Class D sortase n=1 Tax=Alkalihalophilus sp. As8PL TaxID=3237103 RepID=A0AB39BP08_9BACI